MHIFIHSHEFITLPIMLCSLFLGACQSQSIALPEQTVEVTTEIVAMTSSPTPAYTPLLPGMSITIHPYLKQGIIVQLKGFKPGETVDLTGDSEQEGNTQRIENYDLQIGSDGSVSDTIRSSAGTGAVGNHWHIQVTYVGGVACADAYMP